MQFIACQLYLNKGVKKNGHNSATEKLKIHVCVYIYIHIYSCDLKLEITFTGLQLRAGRAVFLVEAQGSIYLPAFSNI